MATPATTEAHYQLLKRPVVTEKTAQIAESGNWLAFEVERSATKPQIKAAVEALYGVEVTRVNTLIRKGKKKGGRLGFTSDIKRALVQLKAGQTADLMAGVK
jgi:large subunit ribosomal protein L23